MDGLIDWLIDWLDHLISFWLTFDWFFCLFSGKILSDDTALKEYKINEKNFVVLMVTKVRVCVYVRVWKFSVFVCDVFSLFVSIITVLLN